MKQQLVSSLWAMIEPILAPEGIELVELEFRPEGGRWVLRLYIDSPGGVTLDECELVNRQVGALLDIKDPIQYPYNLEVSSPGINRVLRKEKDFNLFAGSPVRVRTRRKLEGRHNFVGTLKGMENSKIVLEVDGKRVEIEPEDVEKARLDLPEEELIRRDLRRGAAKTGDGRWGT
ncbi:MAG: ribosome maturation factor RimP [Desulfomonile sp.]|jgi:ribosome maturation factor RimP